MTTRSMTPAELRRWAALDDRRRRQARRGLGALPPLVWALVAGAAIGAWVWLGARDDAGSGSARLIVAAAALFAVVLCGAPFRLFWRRDSPLLARLPLTGRALFSLALTRSLVAAGLVAVALAPGVIALAVAAPALGGRHAALVGALFALAGLAGPAAALAAGAIIASDRAHAALASLSGEFAAPPTVWLGALPALTATAQVLLAIDLAGWAGGGAPVIGDAIALLSIAAAGSLAAALWAHAIADRVMPGALREVAALDRERLAHVDRSTPSHLERAWARLTLRAPGAALVFDKDARLGRRRYPSPYFLGPLGVVVSWLLLLGGDDTRGWSLALVTGLAAYAALMARRALVPPIELPRLGPTLAIAPAEADRAKRAAAALRAVTWIGMAGGPLVVAQPGPLVIGWVAAAAVIPLVAAGRAPRAAAPGG
jgi:hypothetical protein